MYYCSYIIIEIYCNIYYTILCTIYCTKNYITSYICLLEIVLGGEEPLLMDWCHVFTFSKTMFYQQGGLPPLDSVSVLDLFKGFQPITEYIYILLLLSISSDKPKSFKINCQGLNKSMWFGNIFKK